MDCETRLDRFGIQPELTRRTVAELKARGPEFMLHKQNSSFVYDNGTGLQPYFGAPPSKI